MRDAYRNRSGRGGERQRRARNAKTRDNGLAAAGKTR